MLKPILFVLGLATGGAGAAAFLLSQPGGNASATDQLRHPSARLDTLQSRFTAALSEGRREGEAAEQRMRQDYLRSATSSSRG